MKKFYFLAALVAGTALTSCTSEDDLALSPPEVNNVEDAYAPIVFSSLKSNITRADYEGAAAAKLLGNQFVVFGYKGSKTLWQDADDATNNIKKSSTVFDNYLVKYIENTANTTESNSSNWEYVLSETGVPIKHAKDNGIVAQTIKYWDYSQTQYDFFAWSTGDKTPNYEGSYSTGVVAVSEMAATAATDPKTGLASAYTFSGTADDLSQCYISDLVTVYKNAKPTTDAGDYNVVWDGYNKPVTLKFRQLGTKVRIGIYETIPGYSVRNVRFYTTGEVLTNPSTQIVDKATIFTAGADIYKEGTYTVSFPTVDTPKNADNNQAHIVFAPKSGADQAKTVEWGSLNYTIAEKGEKTPGSVYLGRTSNTATFAGDAATNYYVVYLPNSTGANLNLRVDFTMEAIDGGGEIIEVKNAKAQVPSIYTTWKPGYAYTYLFKISDKTNGRTGVYDPTKADDATVNNDPAGLYPITFDAVVVNAEDGDHTQETITTVMTPSITTYQKNSTVVNANEYTANGNNIFVTVNEGDNLVTLTGKAALYTIPDGKTEAEVVDALTYQDENLATGAATGTIKGRSGLVLTPATSTLTNSVEFGADGNAISVNTDQALSFTPASTSTTYAFVYTKTASNPDNNVVKYEALNWANFATGQTKYRYAYKSATPSYINDNGTTDNETDDIKYYDAQKGVKYFSVTGGAYTMVTKPFIGQGVGNLYLDAAGTDIASGYAKTGTTYYYTTNNGMSYQAAENVAYADFAGATDLYTFDGTTYTIKPATVTKPVDGTAYYKQTGGTGTTTDPYVYTYCVILPQQTTGWYELDTTKYVEATETDEVVGQTYFDKYIKNDGEYYVKVIKVQ